MVATVPQKTPVVCGPRKKPARELRASIAHPGHPGERLVPLQLVHRPMGAVGVALLLLAPASLEGEPLERAVDARVGRDEHRLGLHAPERGGRVVAPEAGAALRVLDEDGG